MRIDGTGGSSGVLVSSSQEIVGLGSGLKLPLILGVQPIGQGQFRQRALDHVGAPELARTRILEAALGGWATARRECGIVVMLVHALTGLYISAVLACLGR